MTNGEAVIPNTLLLPDGDRRWALRNGCSYGEAYEQGAARVVEIARHIGVLGGSDVWVGLMSPANFERDAAEVTAILDACLRIHEIGATEGDPVNVTTGGRLHLMPQGYLAEFRRQQEERIPGAVTAHLLLGWSAEGDVADVVHHARTHPEAAMDLESMRRIGPVKERVDLIIRTGIPEGQGGRLSALAPWHSLDAELSFTEVLWPDFTTENFKTALANYRQRRPRNSRVKNVISSA